MTSRKWNPALALLLLLMGGSGLTWGCARPSRPPGGPPDRIPPMVQSTWPDTFEVIEATRKPVVINFNERISERPAELSRLDQAVLVSPETGEVRVKHNRRGLEVSVLGGFKPDLVYRVRVLRNVKDLFNNQMEGPFELVFSTGGEFEAHVLAGVVRDRITDEPVGQARVEARELVASDTGVVVNEDAPAYVAQTDEEGIFLLRYLPSGSYDVSIFRDNNRNKKPDFSELKGTTGQTLGMFLPKLDTIIAEVDLLASDTTVARLIGVEAVDSTLLKLSFDDFLLPEDPLTGVEVKLVVSQGKEEEIPEDSLPAVESPESPPVPGPGVERVLWQRQLDSLFARQDSLRAADSLRQVADSLRGVADSLSAALVPLQASGDTVEAPALLRELEAIQAILEPEEGPVEERAEPEETEEVPVLPEQFFYVLLSGPLESELPYLLTVSAVQNVNRLQGGGGEATFSWSRPEPPPEDSSAVVADTLVATPDSIPPDTFRMVPDSIPPDTGRVVFRGVFPPGKGRRCP